MKLLIAEASDFSEEALAALRQVVEVRTGDLSRQRLLESLDGIDMLWVRLRNRIDREVMDAAPDLKLIVTNTTGVDHVDLKEAARRKIRVLSLRGETGFLTAIRGTAELTIALLLSLVRHVPAAAAHVRAGGWDRYGFKGIDLFGKTAGVVGYGRLGRIVGRYLAAFGMRVIAATKDPETCGPEPGVTLMPLDQVLRAADVVTLHVNLDSDTRGMIGAREFATMKPRAWFLNTARGELVDEGALLGSLESGHLAGAALDVVSDSYETDRVSPLRAYASTHDNLLITPHIGGYTVESLAATEVFLATRLIEALGTPAVVEEHTA